MLVKVILPTGEPVEYEYDGNQRLISRKSSDGVDNFVQSGWDIVTKMDDVGKRTYYTGMSAVSGTVSSSGSSAMESEDSVKYFHYNHRGDTVLVTDAEGSILNNFSYEAYGKPTNNEGIPINTLSLTNATDPGDNSYSTTGTGNTSGGSGNNLPNLFVGASGIRYDTKTDLHYMRFRWFSPSQMRFISPDLLMDLNRYAYVSGNPVNMIDPNGLRRISAVGGIGPRFNESYITVRGSAIDAVIVNRTEYASSISIKPRPIPKENHFYISLGLGIKKILGKKDKFSSGLEFLFSDQFCQGKEWFGQYNYEQSDNKEETKVDGGYNFSVGPFISGGIMKIPKNDYRTVLDYYEGPFESYEFNPQLIKIPGWNSSITPDHETSTAFAYSPGIGFGISINTQTYTRVTEKHWIEAIVELQEKWSERGNALPPFPKDSMEYLYLLQHPKSGSRKKGNKGCPKKRKR